MSFLITAQTRNNRPPAAEYSSTGAQCWVVPTAQNPNLLDHVVYSVFCTLFSNDLIILFNRFISKLPRTKLEISPIQSI
jgi:hypothetical protein